MRYIELWRTCEAITFDELVQHGLSQPGVNIRNGMPWSFTYQGSPVTHETDDCYIVSNKDGSLDGSGSFRVGRDDVLVTGAQGALFVNKAADWNAKHIALPGAARAATDAVVGKHKDGSKGGA